MKKTELRFLIKHYYIICTVVGEIQKWFNDFHYDCTSADSTRPPKDVNNPEKVEKIHDVMLKNPKVNFCELVEATTMSYGSLFNIKHDILV